MPTALHNRVVRLEQRVSPPDDIAEYLDANIAKLKRHQTYGNNGQWEILNRELLDDLREELVTARRNIEWLDANPNDRISSLLKNPVHWLSRQLTRVKDCQREQGLSVFETPELDNWGETIRQAETILNQQ